MVKPRPRGRPPSLTPEIQAKLVEIIRAAGTTEDAATKVGVNKATIYNWLAKGRAQRRGMYRDFLDAIEAARSHKRMHLEAQLLQHGRKHWQALAFIAERTEPERFGLRLKVRLEEELHIAIERLTHEFADDADTLERALSAIAGDHRPIDTEPAPRAEDREDDRSRAPVQPTPPEF